MRWRVAWEIVGLVILSPFLGAGGGFILGACFQQTRASERLLVWTMERGLVGWEMGFSWAALGMDGGAVLGLMVAVVVLTFPQRGHQ
jgi:hypothetical protein